MQLTHFVLRSATLALGLALTAGCPAPVDDPDGDHDHDHDHEVITTVELTFAPQGGGDELVFTWADPEDDGDPVIDTLALTLDTTYDLSVRFLDELSEPVVDVTPEVLDEGDQHQVLIYGDAVDGPAAAGNDDALVTHAYGDDDENGFPLGLENTIETVSTGTGTLSLMLRHRPLEGGEAVKTDTLAADFADDGATALPGAADIDVTFDVDIDVQ